ILVEQRASARRLGTALLGHAELLGRQPGNTFFGLSIGHGYFHRAANIGPGRLTMRVWKTEFNHKNWSAFTTSVLPNSSHSRPAATSTCHFFRRNPPGPP